MSGRGLVVVRQRLVAVAPLDVGDGVLVGEGELGPVVHLAQRLELWPPPRQPVVNKPRLLCLLLLIATGCGGVGRPQRAEAPGRRPRALHAPHVVGVRRERVAVIVGLPDDPRHVALEVHVRARRRRLSGVHVAAAVARLAVSSVVGVGSVATVAGGGSGGVMMVVVVVMRDAEVGGAGAAGGAGRVDFLLGAGGRLDEGGGRAGRRLRQTGAERTLQLCDVITVLQEEGGANELKLHTVLPVTL